MLPWAQLIVGLFLGKVMGEMCTAWCRHRASRCLQDRLFQGVPGCDTVDPAHPHARNPARLGTHVFCPPVGTWILSQDLR